MRKSLFAALLAVLAVLASPSLAGAGDAILLKGGTVLPQDGPVLAPGDVLLDGTTIAAIGTSITPPQGCRVVNVAGRFVIPGLIDMHAHVANEKVFPELFLAHGVTTVRDMGNQLDMIRGLRKKILDGKAPGPELVYVGPILDGQPPVWPPISEVLDDPKKVPALVKRLKEAGVVGLKVYERLEPEVYDAIVAEAKKVGLPVVGHVPEAVGAARCIAAGQATIEHLSHLAPLISRTPVEPGLLGEITGWSDTDPAKEDALIEKLLENGVRLDPTLVVVRNMSRAVRGIDGDVPEARYLPKLLKETFWGPFRGRPRADAETDAVHDRALARRRAFVARARAAGIVILAGSDTPNPNVVPGASLHEELEELAAAIGPVEALRAATLMNAHALGRRDLGRIEAHARADLLVLREDPRVRIQATRSIETIVARGRVLDRAAVDALLDRATKASAEVDGTPASGFGAIDGPLSNEKPRGEEHRLEGRLGKMAPALWVRAHAFELEDGGTDRRMRTSTSLPFPSKSDETLTLDPAGKPRSYVLRRTLLDTMEVTVLLDAKEQTVVLSRATGGRQTIKIPPTEVVEAQGGLLCFDALARLGLEEGESKTVSVRRVDLDRLALQDPQPWTVTRRENPVTDAKDPRAQARSFVVDAGAQGGRLDVWLDDRGLPVGLDLGTPFGVVSVRALERPKPKKRFI